jgi:ABC-2 type transport system ATP-binding protein
MPSVEVHDLVIRYGNRTAVDGLSLTAEPGQITALLGPNGAGKTSTVESLEGYRRPQSGTVKVLGLDPVADRRAVVGRIGVMLQRGGVYPVLNARQVLELFSRYYPKPQSVDHLLNLVSLNSVAKTPWRQLSGGEQQRLSLALALVGRPEVVFLDEPTAGVDPEGRLDVRNVIADLKEGGVCVLLTTHELPEAEILADRVIIVKGGKQVAEGTPTELTTLGGAAAVRFSAPAHLDIRDLADKLGAHVSEYEPGHYRIEADGSPKLTSDLAAWLAEQNANMTDLRTSRTLEEVYLDLVGETGAPENDAWEDTATRRSRRGRT